MALIPASIRATAEAAMRTTTVEQITPIYDPETGAVIGQKKYQVTYLDNNKTGIAFAAVVSEFLTANLVTGVGGSIIGGVSGKVL